VEKRSAQVRKGLAGAMATLTLQCRLCYGPFCTRGTTFALLRIGGVSTSKTRGLSALSLNPTEHGQARYAKQGETEKGDADGNLVFHKQ